MSNVEVINKTLIDQRVNNLENSKVFLPFNVSKSQVEKLQELLNKIKVTFLATTDKLSITSLSFANNKIKSIEKPIPASNFSLSKTYVVTMKKSFIPKISSFYNRIETKIIPERPIFNIEKETNLKEALQEATAEIDLNKINASLNASPVQPQPVQNTMPEPQPVVNNSINEPVQQPSQIEIPQVMPAEPVRMAEPTEQVTKLEVPVVEPQIQNQQVQNSQIQPLEQQTPVIQPNVKVQKLKGHVFAIPIVIVWLAAVLYGSIKLVTMILT